MLETECLHCGAEFVPNKRGHLYCSPLCRHRGPREVHERRPVDEAQVARLFDESRDPDERARPDDWHPGPPEFAELDSFDLLEKRRRWYTSLRDRGLL
jgi:hypothetical protein